MSHVFANLGKRFACQGSVAALTMFRSSTSKREQLIHLLRRLRAARLESDQMFSLLDPSALYRRPIPERHRLIFYLGHLEAFDWSLLHESLALGNRESTNLDRLFAFGIDPDPGGLPQDQPSDWPSQSAVYAYREQQRNRLDDGLSTADVTDIETLLNVAIEHRLMHVETLAYMVHQLPAESKFQRRQLDIAPPQNACAPPMIRIPAGRAVLGMPKRADQFGWDNELEELIVEVPQFSIDALKVTNGDFLAFLAQGGYQRHDLWTEEGWRWKSLSGIDHPTYWVRHPTGFQLRTMFAEIPLRLDWPVYVSQHEATAFANWMGKALPTEAEWHRAAFGTQSGQERKYPWGSEDPIYHRGNFNFRSWDPSPVGSAPDGMSAFGVSEMIGNGWEWTSTPFAPFPGFEPFPFYPGYSANFFDGKHFVLKGASPRTAACFLRRSFRNWFRPEYRFAYAGFRCVRH